MTLIDISQNPDAFQTRKLPIPVLVKFAVKPGILTTLEGPVPYAAGDAILTGIEGENWPITREHFDQTYQAVSPTKIGEAGEYLKRPITVWALQVTKTMDIPLNRSNSTLHAAPGDYIVQYAPNDWAVVANRIFAKTYFTQSQIR